MDVTGFTQQLLKVFRSKREDSVEVLVSGSATTAERYQAVVSRIRTLDEMMHEMKELLERKEQLDD